MPIRRAAGTPPQETPPKNPPAGEPDASSEESASTGEEQESEAPAAAAPPAEGEANAESEKAQSTAEQGDKEKEPAEEPKKEEKDVVKEKGKKVKRTIPAWATMSANQLARSQKKSHLSLYIRPKIDEILTEAIQACFQKTGASAFAVRKYILKKYPSLELDRRGYLLKQALKRVLQRGAIKQVKGKGFSGSFTVVNNSKRSRKRGSTSLEPTEKLGDALPLIFTRLCEPKEASYRLIKKYVEQYFPKLKVDSRPQMLKNALQKAVEKGQLEQLTGKGASGTFQLKRAGDKPLLSGAGLEQAILCAITAMNEPKTCSTTALKRFILENSQGGKVSLQVNNLKRTLRRCEMIGWMEQISGKGFNGSYQLCFPYYPSPATLFPDKHKEEEKEKEEKKMKVKVEEDSSEEEESEEEEDESSEEETSDSEDEPPPPKKRPVQKRPPPKVRAPLPPKRRRPAGKSRSTTAQKARAPVYSPKAKRTAPAKKPAPVKKAPPPPPPPKKAPPPAPVKAAPPPPIKAPPPAKKPTPAKKAAPPKKPKTPVSKKMTSRAPKKSPAKKTAPKPAVKAKPASRKSQRTRK